MSKLKMIMVSALVGSASLICVAIFYHKKVKRLIGEDRRNRYLFELMKDFHEYYNSLTDDYKKRLFQPLIYMDSKILRLKKALTIRILEIGTGAGANLSYYPPNCRLIAVESNPYFEATFRKNLKKNPGVLLEKYITGSIEDLSRIESGSVDVVVSTLVLCSVSNLTKVYKEIHRVLVPGGKFLFMEHIMDKAGSWLYYKQKLLTITGYWPLVYGCNIDRNLDIEILKCGFFSNIDQERILMRSELFEYLRPHVIGSATKDE